MLPGFYRFSSRVWQASVSAMPQLTVLARLIAADQHTSHAYVVLLATTRSEQQISMKHQVFECATKFGQILASKPLFDPFQLGQAGHQIRLQPPLAFSHDARAFLCWDRS